MSVRLNGSISGFTELDAPAAAGNNTIRMPASNGAAHQAMRNGSTPGQLEFADDLVLGTAKTWNWNGLTTNTFIDFTDIPSWAKRVTVMFNGVSTSGTSNYLVQIGSGSFATSGYLSNCASVGGGGYFAASSTLGFIIKNGDESTSNVFCGQMVLTTPGSNTWISCHNISSISDQRPGHGAGQITLPGVLDRVRVTANGTDTIDLGSINLMYE